MEQVILCEKEFLVPKEIKELIELSRQDKYGALGNYVWKQILESKSYKNGQISTECLNWLIKEAGSNKPGIVQILISDNYANGKVSEDDLRLASCITKTNDRLLLYQHLSIVDTIRSKNYGNGLISHEMLKLMLETKVLQKDELTKAVYVGYDMPVVLKELLCSENYTNGFDETVQLLLDDQIKLLFKTNTVEQAYSLYCILTSENYANGLISNEQINKIVTSPNAGQILPYSLILTSDIYRDKCIDDETLEMLLDKRFFVIARLISCIISSKNKEIKDQEERENYILAILNLENKEGLCNLCKSYIEKGIVESEDEFAENFTLYALKSLQFEIQSSYTKKRTNN